MLFLDENRVFRSGLSHNMADLVARDRNHPAVIFWSFCECGLWLRRSLPFLFSAALLSLTSSADGFP